MKRLICQIQVACINRFSGIYVVYQITEPLANPLRLTQSVLQITEMLDLYQAELARILGVRCVDIGHLSNGKQCLKPDTDCWKRAALLVRLYDQLYIKLDGNGVAMRNWLRVDNRDLGGVPLLQIVDEGKLENVLIYVKDEL